MSQLSDHLRFYQELGVTGVSRDPRWRRRDEPPHDAQGAEAAPNGANEVPDEVERAEVSSMTFARSSVEALAAIRDHLCD